MWSTSHLYQIALAAALVMTAALSAFAQDAAVRGTKVVPERPARHAAAIPHRNATAGIFRG